MNKTLFLCVFLLLLKLSLSGQDELDFHHLSSKDGFASSKANAIIQDQKGFIWIGTWNGLNRYDGYSCKTYLPSFHDSTTITNREVVELLEDKKGNIWIGTSSGLNCLDPSTGKIKSFYFHNRIISLLEDNESQLWIGTWDGGLYKLNPESGERKHFLPNEIISCIYEDSRHILWVASYNGLIRFDKGKEEYVRYLPENGKNSIAHSKVTQIIESADGYMWIGTWGGGLDKIEVLAAGDRLYFTHYQTKKESGSLTSNVIYKLLYDKYHNLWVGTWNDGLNLLKPEQQNLTPDKAKFLIYKNDLNDQTSLSGNGISSLMVDHSGILWVGAANIDRATIIDTGIRRYKIKIENAKITGEDKIRAFAEFKGQLWIGTTSSLLLYKKKGEYYKPFKAYPVPEYKINQTSYFANSILSLVRDKNGLWVGTEDAGLIYYPLGSDSVISTKKPVYLNQQTNPSIPGDKISSLILSKKNPGVLWIGTLHNGFSKLSFHKNDLVTESFGAGKNEKFISDNNVRTIFEDKTGLVWIGTQNGLNCFNPRTNQFRQFFYSVTDKNSINDNIINAIYEDSFGTLWIGTNSGLNKVIRNNTDGSDKILFKGYSTNNSLKNEIVTNILEDDSRYLWIKFYHGITKFNLETEETAFFLADYENENLERNTTIKSSDGQFIIGNSGGFTTLFPDSLYKLSVPPRVCITDLFIFNESMNDLHKTTTGDHLDQTIPYTQHVDLSYKDKMLTFEFSSMDYKNPDKNSYYYLLEGFDNDWNEIGSRNTATYTNIPPGDYTFKVKATNSNGLWNQDEATLQINICPPWWKTNWAYFFYFTLVVGLLYFFHEYSFIKAREKSELLFEKLKNEELFRLNELKSLFFTDITHELKTPLTLILGPARELMTDKNLGVYASKQAELIKNSAYKLLRLVNQLMEFRKIEMGKTAEIYLQRCDITAMITEVYHSFKPMAESRRIDFELVFEQTPLVAFIDPDKIEKVLFNLVSNAFKYSKDGDKIYIRERLEDENEEKPLLIIEVEDTGIGISEEYKEKVFERFFQVNQIRTQSTGGIGLFLAKALVEQHDGRIELSSQSGKGSCFKVLLPLNFEKQTSVELDDLENCSGSAEIDLPEAEPYETIPSGSHKYTNHKDAPLILIIEDDIDLNDFLVSGLSSEFNMVNAFNGIEGLEKTKKHFPDIIISDIMMPELDGFEFCNIIRKDISTSHIPVVFLTAKTMQEDEIKGLKLGAVDYIYKPFNLISLKLKIHNILANQKVIQEKIRTEQILQPDTIELSSLDEVFLKNAMESVNKYIDDPNFDIELFGRDLGVSPNQAYRKIKILTGQTANEFIRNQRLKYAANLFVQQKRSISEIIYMVGFTSPSYFTRCFKEFYSCTPKEYIKRNAKPE